MAKLESKSSKHEQKSTAKAKKRKHSPQEKDEDEIANKSLILDNAGSPDVPESLPQKKNAKKRKHKHDVAEDISEKRVKNDSDQDNSESEADDDDHGPTMEQLRESEKPENTMAVLTVRQKKKLKHQQRLEAQRSQSTGKEKQLNEAYLQKWKHNRDSWKFEKLRQVSIQSTIFDEQKISEDIWPTALEYLSGSKGAAKDLITKLAESTLEKLDNKCAEAESEADKRIIIDSMAYQRARDLLQSLD